VSLANPAAARNLGSPKVGSRLGRVYSGVRLGPTATTHFQVTLSRVRVNRVAHALRGNTRGDIRLEQVDVIVVPPRSRRVAIRGSVVRLALYDLAQGQGLRELIQMAGGFLPEAYTGRAQVERVLPPDQRQPGREGSHRH
jgi:hypothetical protein